MPTDVLPFAWEDTPGWTRTVKLNPNQSVATVTWTGKLAKDGFVAVPFLASTPAKGDSDRLEGAADVLQRRDRALDRRRPTPTTPAAVTKISKPTRPSRTPAARARERRHAPRRPPRRPRPRPPRPPSPTRRRRQRLRLAAPAHPLHRGARARRRGPRLLAPHTMKLACTLLPRRPRCCSARAVALAHQGNPHYRSVVKTVSPNIPGVQVIVLNFDDRLLLHNTSGKDITIFDYQNKPYAQVNARRHGQDQHRLGGLLPQRGPDSGTTTVPPNLPQDPASGRSSRAAGASSGTTIACTGWAPATRPDLKDKSVTTKIDDWTVPVEVGGQKGKIAGTLTWVPLDQGSLPVERDLRVRGAGDRALPDRLLRAPPPSGRRARRAGRAEGEGGRRGVVRRALAGALVALALAPAAASAHATLESDRSRARREARHGPGAGRLQVRRVGRGELRRAARVRRAGQGGPDRQRVPPRRPRAGDRGQAAARSRRQGTYTATYRVVSADGHVCLERLRLHRRQRRRPVASRSTSCSRPAARPAASPTSRCRSRARSSSASIALGLGALIFFLLVLAPGAHRVRAVHRAAGAAAAVRRDRRLPVGRRRADPAGRGRGGRRRSGRPRGRTS